MKIVSADLRVARVGESIDPPLTNDHVHLFLVLVLFANDSSQAEVKLIDFGLSKMFGHEELTDGVGTMYVWLGSFIGRKAPVARLIWHNVV